MHINVRHFTFAEWLQRVLEEHKKKAIEFSIISNISRSSISRYLSDERVPKPYQQELIIKALCKMGGYDPIDIGHKVRFHCHISHMERLKKK